MADLYKISVALAMSSNHPAILGALSSHLLGVNAQVNQLHGGFNKLKTVISGAFAIGAGVAILDTMVKLVDKTKEYSDELSKLQNLGGDMSKAVTSGALSKQAFDISQRVPMGVVNLMKIPGMTNSMLGTQESLATWEDMAKFAFVLQSQKDYKGDPGSDLQKVMRAGELSGRITDEAGKIDDTKLKAYMDLTTRIVAATHGMVGPDSMLGMAQQGGIALRGLSNEGYLHMAIAAQAFQGQRAGTALMSTWQQLATGQMFKRSAEGLEDVGMLKPGEWRTDKGGRVILAEEASKRLTAMIGNDPLVFAKTMDDNLKAQGITDSQDRLRKIMRALGRATTQRFTAEEAQNYGQIVGETDRINQGYGTLGSLDTFMTKSVSSNIEAVKNAWDNLLTAIASPNSENAIKIMQMMTSGINDVTRVVNGMNPDTMMNIAKGFAVIGGALIGAGGVALLAALGPVGWIAGGIIALGAAAAVWLPQIKALAASEWDHITKGFNQIKDAISGFIEWIMSIPARIKDMFGSIGKGAPEQVFPGGTLRQKSSFSFDPGQQQIKAQPVSLSLNVDGRTLAQAISDQLDSLYGHNTTAPSFNGGGRFET